MVETEILAGVDSANLPEEEVVARLRLMLLVSIVSVIESSA